MSNNKIYNDVHDDQTPSENTSLISKSSIELQDQIIETEFEKKKNVSFLRLAFATICFSGIQFGWALQISQLTPFILELGLPKVLVTIVWLCGPVAGLVVQPLVGALSDRTTSRLGRRRPYILAGALFVILAQLIIPNSLDIGRWFGDTRDKNTAALILAVGGFWLLDISNNMLQGPCRALVADIAGPEQQELGNSVFSLWLALGSITGYIAGWMRWSRFFPFMITSACREACADLRISFLFSVAFLIVTVTVTLFAAREIPLEQVDAELAKEKQPPSPTTGEEPVSVTKVNPLVNLFRVLFKMSPAMRRVCLVQFFSWFGWFTFLIYGTDWVGEKIFNGNPNPRHPAYKLYQEGVRWGSFGLAGFAFVSLLFSPLVPTLTNRFGSKPIFFLGNCVLSLALFLPLGVHNQYVALVVLALFGIPWSVAMTIPFAIVANIAPEEEKGIYMGILNIFVVIPQLCMSAVGALLSLIFKGNVVAALTAGGIAAFISAILTLILIIPEKMHLKKKKRRRRKRINQHSDDQLMIKVASSPGSPSSVAYVKF
jgi:solute carrier family 45 protein 1/2/4